MIMGKTFVLCMGSSSSDSMLVLVNVNDSTAQNFHELNIYFHPVSIAQDRPQIAPIPKRWWINATV